MKETALKTCIELNERAKLYMRLAKYYEEQGDLEEMNKYTNQALATDYAEKVVRKNFGLTYEEVLEAQVDQETPV